MFGSVIVEYKKIPPAAMYRNVFDMNDFDYSYSGCKNAWKFSQIIQNPQQRK